MVQLMEVKDSGGGKKVLRVKASSEYRGPGDDFPYMGFQILGTTHLLLGLAMLTVAVIHMALSFDDRRSFLLTGGVAVWCPLAAVATGILGLCVRSRRYWQVHCLREAFWTMSVVTGFLFMIPLAVVTGIIDFYYYGLSDFDPVEVFDLPRHSPTMAQTTMLWAVIGLAILEFLVCMVSASVACCCAPLYREAPRPKAQQEEIIIKQEMPPPITVIQKEAPKPAMQLVVAKPQVQQQVQVQQAQPQVQVQQVQAHPQVQVQAQPQPQQPIILQAMPQPRPMMMQQAPGTPVMMPRPVLGAAPMGMPGPVYGSYGSVRPPAPPGVYGPLPSPYASLPRM